MIKLMFIKNVNRWLKEMAPALVVLFFTAVFSVFSGYFTFVEGWKAIYIVLFRFFRFTLFLCLPLYILLPIYSFIVDKMKGVLLQTVKKQELHIEPTTHLIFRPFQGIGIGLLFATKLLTTLQLITGATAQPFLFFPPGQFQLGRLLVISVIAVAISLLLSTLWTLDDMGIRYVNRKDQEIKMIGKYIGTLTPIIFGFYGASRLVGDFSKLQALIYLFKIIVILYPPFTVFAVLHIYFIKRRAKYFSKKVSLENIDIWQKGE
jgi:hypothetical protein